jgi:hypothetical protein
MAVAVLGASFGWEAANAHSSIPSIMSTESATPGPPLAAARPRALEEPPTPMAAASVVPRALPQKEIAPAPSIGREPAVLAETPPAPLDGSSAAASTDRESEAHLLARAQDALGTSPARTLALTNEHAARFPSGGLGQERELLAIQALVQLGRKDEARARATRFIGTFPTSAHRHHIETLVGP